MSSNGRMQEPAETSLVEDPDDYSKTRRLQQIFDARQEVRRVRVKTTTTENEVVARRAYAEATRSYVDELTPLIREHEDIGVAYWTDHSLGEQVVEPPDELQETREPPRRHPGETVASNKDRPTPVSSKRITYRGLRDFVEQPAATNVEFTGWTFCDVRGWREQTASKTVVISPEVTAKAYRAANMFLADIGLDLALDDGTPEWGFREVTHE